MTSQHPVADGELVHLRRCVELAVEALEAGDEPFGSVLVDAAGAVLAEARNRVVTAADHTQHPELVLAQWAAAHVAPEARPGCTVFTSGEHCPMCSAAHGWVGLGRIVYVHSAAQLAGWLSGWGRGPAPVRLLPIAEIVPGLPVEGPVPELVEEMRSVHQRWAAGDGGPASGTR